MTSTQSSTSTTSASAYGDFTAVDDLSFQIERGELYALLGTNGAGKTSTLEIIEGHRPAAAGSVRIFGESPRDRRAVRPRMGIMLQESGFSPDLTVRESVGLIGSLSGRHDDVGRVLDVAGLAGKADTQVSQLSGGEKRRLDFATAVYGGPELLILDEPTTGLDVQSRDALWSAVERLRDDGGTVVLTTHYLEEAQQRADRIGLMHQGTVASGRDGPRADADPAVGHHLHARRPDRRRHRSWPPTSTGPCASRPSACRRTSTGSWDGRATRVSSSRSWRPGPPASTTSSVH